MKEIKSQAALLISLKSLMSLDLDILIFLFLMYMAMWAIDFLMLLASEARYSNDPCNKTG